MVEYADFEPALRTAYPIVKTLERDLHDVLAVVVRQFPLISARGTRDFARYAR